MDIELTNIAEWLNANKLTLNILKTKYMIFCTKQKSTNPNVKLAMDGKSLTQVNDHSFLGIQIDKTLDWNCHIKEVTKQIAKINGIIYKVRPYITKDTCIQLYKSLVEPHLMYCNVIWGATLECFRDELIKTQKRIIRTITNSAFLEHTSPLFKENRLLKLDDINKLETLKIMYQHEHNILPKIFHNATARNKNYHDYNTRNKDKYRTTKHNTSIAKRSSIFSRGITLWNALPTELNAVPSPEVFKRNIKTKIFESY